MGEKSEATISRRRSNPRVLESRATRDGGKVKISVALHIPLPPSFLTDFQKKVGTDGTEVSKGKLRQSGGLSLDK